MRSLQSDSYSLYFTKAVLTSFQKFALCWIQWLLHSFFFFFFIFYSCWKGLHSLRFDSSQYLLFQLLFLYPSLKLPSNLKNKYKFSKVLLLDLTLGSHYFSNYICYVIYKFTGPVLISWTSLNGKLIHTSTSQWLKCTVLFFIIFSSSFFLSIC